MRVGAVLEFPRLFHMNKSGTIKHSRDLDMLASGSNVERSKFFALNLMGRWEECLLPR